MKKRLYLKKWVEYLLIMINTSIVCFICSINDFTSILAYILIVSILLIIFALNSIIIKKWGRILIDEEEEN